MSPEEVNAGKLEAVLALLLSADTEEELAAAKKQAAAVLSLTPEEVQGLPGPEEG